MESIAGLDIGSSHVVAAVAVSSGPIAREVKNSGDLNTGAPAQDPAVRGLRTGFAPATGLRRGLVSDIDALSGSIREALSGVEASSGARVAAVCVGFSGHTVEFSRKRYGNLIGKRRVNLQDIERVNRLAVVSDLPPGRRIIQVVPLEYTVDGTPVAGEPLGLHCNRLEVEALIVTADSLLIDQIIEAAHRSGVKVVEIFPSPLAAGEVLLKKAQQQLGTAFVDIGGTCTSVLVYNHGYPAGFEVLPVGGDHITSDLAICLRTTLEGAEEVKRSVGLGPGAGVPEVDAGQGGSGSPARVTIPRVSGSGYNEVPVKNAVEIIEARAMEMLELIGESVRRMAGSLDLPGGLVLAGGGSRLGGLERLALESLGCKVQMASLGRVQEDSAGVNMAGAAGLLKYIMQIRQRQLPDDAGDKQPLHLLGRFRNLFRAFK